LSRANFAVVVVFLCMAAIEAAIKTNNEIVLTQLNQMGFSTKTTWFQKILKRFKK
jgi:hypothetical protein